MPRIPIYQSDIGYSSGLPGANSTSADFGGAVGQALGNLGNEMEQTRRVLEDQQARAEVSDITAKMAAARAEWTVHLQQRAQEAPLGDTTFAGKFDDELTKYLGKLTENLQPTTKAGQNLLAKESVELRAHFFQQAGVHQAASVGKKAVADYSTLLGSNQKTLMLDPTQFDTLFASSKAALNDPNGPYAKMPAESRQLLETQTAEKLAMAAVQGTIITLNAPELAMKQLKEGRWNEYIKGDSLDNVMKAAQVAQNAKDTAAERQRLLAERERKDAQNGLMNGYLSRIIDPKKNGALSDREILEDQTLDWQSKQHLIDYKGRRARELATESESRTNPAEVRRLMLLTHAADDDPKKSYNLDPWMESYRAGRISTAELMLGRREVADLKDNGTQGFTKDVQSARSMAREMFLRSIEGSVQPEMAIDAAYRFQMDLQKKIDDKRAKNEDPRVLLDPGSKEYALSPTILKSYMQPLRQTVAGRAAREAAGIKDAPEAPGSRVAAGRIGGATPTYKDYDKLESGDVFTDPSGKLRKKP